MLRGKQTSLSQCYSRYLTNYEDYRAHNQVELKILIIQITRVTFISQYYYNKLITNLQKSFFSKKILTNQKPVNQSQHTSLHNVKFLHCYRTNYSINKWIQFQLFPFIIPVETNKYPQIAVRQASVVRRENLVGTRGRVYNYVRTKEYNSEN